MLLYLYNVFLVVYIFANTVPFFLEDLTRKTRPTLFTFRFFLAEGTTRIILLLAGKPDLNLCHDCILARKIQTIPKSPWKIWVEPTLKSWSKASGSKFLQQFSFTILNQPLSVTKIVILFKNTKSPARIHHLFTFLRTTGVMILPTIQDIPTI